jgi:large subunit ribosomal protein L13Ae
MGRLSHEVGWKYQDIVKTLEEKRKAKAKLYWQNKKRLEKLKEEAVKQEATKLEQFNKVLEQYGHM